MAITINPADLLKDFFYKTLLIRLSTRTVDQKWGDNLKTHISNHVFTDPFKIDEQTDPEKVMIFNQLMGTNWTTIKWRNVKSSGCQLYIDQQNRDEFIPEANSQLYLQLSIPVFENLIILLKNFVLNCTSRRSIGIINDFYTEFKTELNHFDVKNVSYNYPTVLLLHNLRLFRNCIIHSNSSVSQLEKGFDNYNKSLESNKDYEDLKDLGSLSKNIFCYKFSKDNSKIFF